MKIFVLGFSHQTTPIHIRERLHVDDVAAFLHALSGYVVECAALATCNRLEVYAVAESSAPLVAFLSAWYREESLAEYLYVHEGEAAIHHLMRVASGLDSIILGESQILGQVASALSTARAAGTLGITLERLFTQSITAGKRARTETDINQHTLSISHAAARLARHAVKQSARILVIGAGETAGLVLKALHSYGMRNITLTNRTQSRAEAYSDYAAIQPWETRYAALAAADVVISATGAPSVIFTCDDIHAALAMRPEHPLLLIDIALPRDIAPDSAALDGVTYYDIDALKAVVADNLKQRQACVSHVETIIAESTAQYLAWMKSRTVSPVIAELRRKIETVAADEVQHTLNRLSHLDTREQQLIAQLAQRIVNKVLHEPTVQLKAQAAAGDADNFAQALSVLFALPDVDSAS